MLRVKRLAIPSYTAWCAEVASNGAAFENLKEINDRQGLYDLDVGTHAVTVNNASDASRFTVRVRLNDGRECDITAIIDGEQNLT